MADSIGVIASATSGSVATTTVYTVPTGKAIIFKPQFIAQANAGGSTFAITINGAQLFSNAVAASAYFWSSTTALFIENATYPTGESVAQTVAPAVALAGFGGWYASAGHVISYTVATNALISINFQLVGSIIDV